MFRSEPDFVSWLSRQARTRDRRVRLGIGDDAALVRMGRGRELALTTDFSIEGVHFNQRLHPPQSVGHRALARALSDLAAMGTEPRFALVSLAISKGTTSQWMEGFYEGIRLLAERFGVSIIGGDTAVVSGCITVDAIAAGEVGRGQAVLRSGARPGDLIFVSGRLGVSELGLRLLKSRTTRSHGVAMAADAAAESRAIHHHLFPEPQCRLGRYLAARRLATAMMDLSDGLSSDLTRLCEASRVGARIREDLIPAPAMPSREQALHLALHGGEDYELLFTVPPSKVKNLPRSFRGAAIRQIGEISRNRKLTLIEPGGRRTLLQPSGYDHFRKK